MRVESGVDGYVEYVEYVCDRCGRGGKSADPEFLPAGWVVEDGADVCRGCQ